MIILIKGRLKVYLASTHLKLLNITLDVPAIAMTGESPKRVYASLTNEQRLAIYEKKYHPDGRVKSGSPSLDQLPQWAAREFSPNRVPDKTTISKILKRIREEGPGSTSRSNKRKRIAKGKWPVSIHAIYYSSFKCYSFCLPTLVET